MDPLLLGQVDTRYLTVPFGRHRQNAHLNEDRCKGQTWRGVYICPRQSSQPCPPESPVTPLFLQAAEWEQLAVTSQSIVQAATEAASLALPQIAPDIRSFGKDAQVVCHRVELPLSLRREESTGGRWSECAWSSLLGDDSHLP